MSNVHGLFSSRRSDDGDDDDDDENNRYVGGIGDRGGGSGLAVRPNVQQQPDNNNSSSDAGGDRDSVFRLAENATAEDGGQIQRTITMYRNGFVVDDGPYRRLDDPANAEFLRALAMGRTPRELLLEAEDSSADVIVGLVDKRSEDFVEEFRSFSGQGTSLGTRPTESSASSVQSIFDPTTLPENAPAVDDGKPTTSVAVRLVNGQRRVVRINLGHSVADLAAHLRDVGSEPFRLVAGFPPKPLEDPTATIEAAGLKGAQVSMQKP